MVNRRTTVVVTELRYFDYLRNFLSLSPNHRFHKTPCLIRCVHENAATFLCLGNFSSFVHGVYQSKLTRFRFWLRFREGAGLLERDLWKYKWWKLLKKEQKMFLDRASGLKFSFRYHRVKLRMIEIRQRKSEWYTIRCRRKRRRKKLKLLKKFVWFVWVFSVFGVRVRVIPARVKEILAVCLLVTVIKGLTRRYFFDWNHASFPQFVPFSFFSCCRACIKQYALRLGRWRSIFNYKYIKCPLIFRVNAYGLLVWIIQRIIYRWTFSSPLLLADGVDVFHTFKPDCLCRVSWSEYFTGFGRLLALLS